MFHSMAVHRLFILITLCLCLAVSVSQSRLTQTVSATQTQLNRTFGQLPLRFERNQGQTDATVEYLARGPGYGLFLTRREAVLQLRRGGEQNTATQVRMRLVGANPDPLITGYAPLGGQSHYFLGNQPQRWRTGIAAYAQVKYSSVYPGIDLLWYGNQQQLEHDFLLAPGAPPQRIKLAFEGTKQIALEADGALRLQLADDALHLLKPRAWQEIDGTQRAVACEFRLEQPNHVGFVVGDYDPALPLVIDPVLLYSTYLGGTNYDAATAVAVDQAGNAYLTGETASLDFPLNTSLQGAPGGLTDSFVLKLSPNGQTLLYATWLGGSGQDLATGIAVDRVGNAYVTGRTTSTEFPTTNGAFQTTYPSGRELFSQRAFVAKLNASGSALLYSTYLGGSGSDTGTGIAVDAENNAVVTGTTTSFDLLSGRANVPGLFREKRGQALFKSSNGAANWQPSNNGVTSSAVTAIAFDPKNPLVGLASTTNRLFKTTDGGATWVAFDNANPASGLPVSTQLVFDPVNSNVLYAVSFNFAIYKSTDGGVNWVFKQLSSNGPTSARSLLLDPVQPTTIYVAAREGVFKSTDGGNTWGLLNNGLAQFGNQVLVNALALDPGNRTTLYAATDRGMFKTVNGEPWQPINSGLGPVLGQVYPIPTLALDPAAPQTLYATINNNGVFKTTDGGQSWRPFNNGLQVPNATFFYSVTSLAIDPATANTVYALTQNNGVFKTADGSANWMAVNNGLPALGVRTLALDRATPANLYVGVATGGDGYVAKLNAAGSALQWLNYLGGSTDDSANAVAVDRDGAVYVAGATASGDFPTLTPLQPFRGADAFITKFNAGGTALVYSTWLGGAGTDVARALTVSATGQAVVAGSTNSTAFPTTNPLQAAHGGGVNDGFVARFNPAGSALEISTYLGGSADDQVFAAALDNAGQIYLTGVTASPNFPTRDAPQPQARGGTTEAFVTKLAVGGNALVYSTFLGGSATEQGNGIAVDANGNAVIVGSTTSTDFPIAAALQPLRGGSGSSSFSGSDAFAARIGVEADLALTKTAPRSQVQRGGNLVYTLTATNLGPSPASAITLTDSLPAGVSFVSATASQGTCAHNAGTVICNLGNLAAAARATVALTVTINITGMLNNTARISAPEPDIIAANNQATATLTASTLPSLFGRVSGADGVGLAGVTVTLGGSQTATRTTDANGFYQFAELPLNGNYTVTPARNGFSFEPPTHSFTNLTTEQAADFAATTCTYQVTIPNGKNFPATGGTGFINITAPPRCPWTAESNSAWLRITANGSGQGDGISSFSVAPTTEARAGRVTVAGQRLAIYQSANTCTAPAFRVFEYGLDDPGVYYPFEAFSDFNGDGKLELVQVLPPISNAPSDRRVAIIYTAATEGNGFRVLAEVPLPPSTGNLIAGDFNLDGRMDLVALRTTGTNQTQALPLLNEGQGQFTRATEIQLSGPLQRNPLSLTVSDLNRDGQADLIFSFADVTRGNGVYVTLSNGRGGYQPPVEINLGSVFIRGIADFTGDGVLDLLTYPGNFLENELRVYAGDGAGSFAPPLRTPTNIQVHFVNWSDFNNDGWLDLLLAGNLIENGRIVSSDYFVQPGLGEGRFSAPRRLNRNNPPQTLLLEDFNNDGRTDLLFPGFDGGASQLLPGDGAGNFGAALSLPSFPVMRGLLAGRFNQDGAADIILLPQSGRLRLFTSTCGKPGFSIFGTVTQQLPTTGIPAVTLKLSGARTAETVTDVGGNYEFTDLPARGNYTLNVERTGFGFTPATQSLTNLARDENVNFRAARQLAVVSAASYRPDSLAPDSIATIFGADLALTSQAATTTPLPLSLGGTRVSLQDALPTFVNAPLFFVAPNQINLLIPGALLHGQAYLSISSPALPLFTGLTTYVRLERVAPGLFSLDATGRGLATAVIYRIRVDGTQVFEPVARFDPLSNQFNAVPIDVFNPFEQVYLLLFGTGWRHRTALTEVMGIVDGRAFPVSFAGAQGDLQGLDQINLRLNDSLRGRGEVNVSVTVEGKVSNAVKLQFK